MSESTEPLPLEYTITNNKRSERFRRVELTDHAETFIVWYTLAGPAEIAERVAAMNARIRTSEPLLFNPKTFRKHRPKGQEHATEPPTPHTRD